MEIFPMRVVRVVSVHLGSRGLEKLERACLPMSRHCESRRSSGLHNVLWGRGGGAGPDGLNVMHAGGGIYTTLFFSDLPGISE